MNRLIKIYRSSEEGMKKWKWYNVFTFGVIIGIVITGMVWTLSNLC